MSENETIPCLQNNNLLHVSSVNFADDSPTIEKRSMVSLNIEQQKDTASLSRDVEKHEKSDKEKEEGDDDEPVYQTLPLIIAFLFYIVAGAFLLVSPHFLQCI